MLGNDSGTLNEAPEVTTPPSSGTARVEGRQIIYEPSPGFTGTDTFGYRICSPGTTPLCAEATVTVDVVGTAPAPTPSPEPSPEPTDPTPSPGTGGGSGAGTGGGTSGTVGAPGATDGSTSGLGSLAGTGGPAAALLAAGLVMVLVGTALIVVRRRRT